MFLRFTLMTVLVAMEELMALPDLKLPVTFTSDDGTITKKFTDKPDKGGEGYVWHVDNEAWKVFTNRDTYDKKFNDCEAAKAAGLPMGGDPKQYPYFKKGTVTQGNGTTSEGFLIVSWWLSGRRFFGKIRKSFKAALKEQTISHSKGDAKYQKYVHSSCSVLSLPKLFQGQSWVRSC